MRDIAFVFFLAAVLCVTAGMALGLWMGPTGNFQFAPVHAHLNLVGWATMALFAIYYRLTPQAVQGWLPRVHASLAIVGIVLMTAGLAGEIAGRPEFFPMLMAGLADDRRLDAGVPRHRGPPRLRRRPGPRRSPHPRRGDDPGGMISSRAGAPAAAHLPPCP